MRFLWEDTADEGWEWRYGSIKEISRVDLDLHWKIGRETNVDAPDQIFIKVYPAFGDVGYVGEYTLPENEQEHEAGAHAALANYAEVLEKLAAQGCCRETDFKNVDWNIAILDEDDGEIYLPHYFYKENNKSKENNKN